MRWRELVRSVLDFMYPPLCPLCGRLLPGDEPLCASCIAALPRTEQDRKRGNLTEAYFVNETRFLRGGAFLFYTPSVVPKGGKRAHDAGELLRLIKYNRRPDIGTFLGALAAREWQASGFFDGIDLIIPVPLHPRRLRKRGYNQSLFIARGLSRVTGIPVDTEHLVRTKNNPHQARMNIAEREHNVLDIFQLQNSSDLSGKHLLLVDDIITTGNTLRACLKPFHRLRSCTCSVFTLAVTRHR